MSKKFNTALCLDCMQGDQDCKCSNPIMCPVEITDSERLDWMIENEAHIKQTQFLNYFVAAMHIIPVYGKTPREAIDKVIEESRK